MRMAWRNFIRNRRSTLAAVLAVAALAAFLLVYSDNIRRSEAELDNAYDTVPVNAYIAGASATQLPSFNETLWYGTVEQVRVLKDGKLRFIFKDGSMVDC